MAIEINVLLQKHLAGDMPEYTEQMRQRDEETQQASRQEVAEFIAQQQAAREDSHRGMPPTEGIFYQHGEQRRRAANGRLIGRCTVAGCPYGEMQLLHKCASCKGYIHMTQECAGPFSNPLDEEKSFCSAVCRDKGT